MQFLTQSKHMFTGRDIKGRKQNLSSVSALSLAKIPFSNNKQEHPPPCMPFIHLTWIKIAVWIICELLVLHLVLTML